MNTEPPDEPQVVLPDELAEEVDDLRELLFERAQMRSRRIAWRLVRDRFKRVLAREAVSALQRAGFDPKTMTQFTAEHDAIMTKGIAAAHEKILDAEYRRIIGSMWDKEVAESNTKFDEELARALGVAH